MVAILPRIVAEDEVANAGAVPSLGWDGSNPRRRSLFKRSADVCLTQRDVRSKSHAAEDRNHRFGWQSREENA
jgi:hypothetical protein